MTPPSGVVTVPAFVATATGTTERSREPASSWAPLFGHPGFALWLRTPSSVEHVALRDLSAEQRVLTPWSAARYGPVLELAQRHEIRVFIGTCAADLEVALERPERAVRDALRDPRLAGFIVRGDPDEVTLRRLRERLDARDAQHLALGRSMHGAPLRPGSRSPWDGVSPTSLETISDFTVVAPFRAAITPKPDATPIGAAGTPQQPLGASGLAAWISTKTHVIAMGGVTVSAAHDAVALGARGIAGIDAFFGDAAGVAQNAQAFAALLPRPARPTP